MTDFDVKQNLEGLIRNSLNVIDIDGYYYLFKRINKDRTSEYDSSFVYGPPGSYVEVKDADNEWDNSCSTGIHASTANYYLPSPNHVHIALKIHIDDIITCQEGKVRCRRAQVMS